MVNTTLVVFALIAALGLVTAILVVEPSIPQAFAQGNNGQGHIKACGANPNAKLNAKICTGWALATIKQRISKTTRRSMEYSNRTSKK